MKKTLLALMFLFALPACSGLNWGSTPSYKIPVHQGNELEPEAVMSLRPGMSKAQVQMLLGTSLLQDPFHRQRWDYPFFVTRGGNLKKETRLTVYFDNNDKLTNVTGDALDEARRIVEERSTYTPSRASSGWSMPGNASNQGAGESDPGMIFSPGLPSHKYLKDRGM